MTTEAIGVGANFGEAGGVGGICIGRIETFAFEGASDTGLGEAGGVRDAMFATERLVDTKFDVGLWSHESPWSQTAILDFALACLE